MASNDDIMHTIGRLEARMDAVGESLGHLREDVIDEKQHAHESRATIHQRLDLQAGKTAIWKRLLPSAGRLTLSYGTAFRLW